jgi:hypothetical protein
MSSRLFAGSLLLVVVAVFAFSIIARTQQSAPGQRPAPAQVPTIMWEYKVIRTEGNLCASEPALNNVGQQGWELVAYDRVSSPFPKDAEGSLLIVPAATGANKDINPPTADSFQGKISMKMSEVPPAACLMVFKRQFHP